MRALLAVLSTLTVAGCEARSEAPPLTRAVPIEIASRAVAPESSKVGALTFAGGVELTAPRSSLLGGLSDLDVADDGRVLMVTDEGDLVQARIVLDDAGRLIGLADVTVRGVVNGDGRPIAGKELADAEDVTFLPDGGFAIAFERMHRVLAYEGPDGPVRRRVDLTGHVFTTEFEGGAGVKHNRGFEGLAWADVLTLGTEDGVVFECRDRRRCTRRALGKPGGGWSLTGLDALDGNRLISVWRAHPLFGWRGMIAGPDGRELARLEGPLGANFEGIAAVPRGAGWRLYVLSDDGFGETGRTLLLAFDWDGTSALRR